MTYLPVVPVYNHSIKRGDDFAFTFDIDVDGTVLNLQTDTVLSSINTKSDGSGTTIEDFTVTVNASNEVTLSLTDVQTANITESHGFYDVLVIADTDFTHYLKGEIDFVGTVTRGANSSIAISSPANGATVTSPVTFSANVTTAAGRAVSNVKFYANGTLLNTDSAAPYTYSWAANAGSYVLSATVTDDKGTYTSSNVSVTVS